MVVITGQTSTKRGTKSHAIVPLDRGFLSCNLGRCIAAQESKAIAFIPFSGCQRKMFHAMFQHLKSNLFVVKKKYKIWNSTGTPKLN